jgi:predicted heme/steroid binding protein
VEKAVSIYLDLKTIRQLVRNYYSREQRVFTIEELERFNGRNKNPAYVAVNGIVYDVSRERTWGGASHFGLKAGKDLSEQFKSCHGMTAILQGLPKVGILK